jgi:hypothetical protein
VTHRVVFAPEAEDQLAALYRYIASASSADIADQFTEAIVQFCESLSTVVCAVSIEPSAATLGTSRGQVSPLSNDGVGLIGRVHRQRLEPAELENVCHGQPHTGIRFSI